LADSSFAVDQTRTGIMARWRHAVELAMTDEAIGKLTEISLANRGGEPSGAGANGDAEFEQKMAEVLCVYREVQVLKKAAAKPNKPEKPVAIVSYDEKPGIQAIATTVPDLPPVPGVHATFARDHEYSRRSRVVQAAR